MDRSIVRFYRTADDFRRYTVVDRKRRADLERFYRRHRRRFGRSVLDLACGGGVLGAVVSGHGHRYVGVDASPDMIRAAREAARAEGSPRTFVHGDISRVRIPGRFDTVTLLGNALGHLRIDQMAALLRRRAVNVHRGSTFLVDYRDLVGMLWHETWSHGPFVQRHKRGTAIFRSRSADTRAGLIRIRGRAASGAWAIDFTHAIWSPFILDALMRAHGWEPRERAAGRHPNSTGRLDDYWEDVFEYRGPEWAAREG